MPEEVDVSLIVSCAFLNAGDVVVGAVASATKRADAVEALVELLNGESSRDLAVGLSQSLQPWFLSETSATDSDLIRLLARTLERVVTATAAQSRQAPVVAERKSLQKLATRLAERGEGILQAAVGSASLSQVLGSQAPDAHQASLLPLDRHEWMAFLQPLREHCGVAVSDVCLSVIAEKLRRQFPQAALAALKSRSSDFSHLRAAVFRQLLIQFSAVVESVRRSSSEDELAREQRFLEWAESLWHGDCSELFGENLRERWPQVATSIDSALLSLREFVSGAPGAAAESGEPDPKGIADVSPDETAVSRDESPTPEPKTRDQPVEQSEERLAQVRAEIARLLGEERELQAHTVISGNRPQLSRWSVEICPLRNVNCRSSLQKLRTTSPLDQWGQLCGCRGELEEARQTYERLRTLAAGDSRWKMRAACNLGQLLLRGDDPSGAKAALLQALADYETLPRDTEDARQLAIDASDWLVTVGELELAEGSASAALQHFRRSLEVELDSAAAGTADRLRIAANARLLARIADLEHAEGDSAAAIDHYRQSLSIAESLATVDSAAAEMLCERAELLLKLARLQLATGDRAGAGTLSLCARGR